MKFELFSDETNKLWKKMAASAEAGLLEVELELYKRLLNFFQVGDYYYFVFNLNALACDFVSPQVWPVLGFEPAELTVPVFMESMHPDDLSWFLTFETKTAEFLSGLPVDKLTKYKARYDFRFRKKDGEYIRILHQVAVIQHDEAGGIVRTLGVHTDITHLKQEGKPVLSYIGMDGEPSYIDVDIKNAFVESQEVLSKREKEVLILLIEGKPSKDISRVLNISKQTVDTHRKNMFRKTSINSTPALIAKAIKSGWV